MIPAAIGAFVLLTVVVFLIVRPFVAPTRHQEGPSLDQLLADRDRLRAQLRELDMDFETGKLGEAEHGKLRSRRLQQIEATTRAIHEVQAASEGSGEMADAAGAASHAAGDLDRELERRIAERKQVLEELEANACPGCGTTTDPDDRFCRRCGADLATAETR